MKILFKGTEMNLVGNQLEIGSKAKNFKAIDKDMNEFNLFDLKGNVVVLTSFPSIDTSVCALQARRFNVEASKLKNVKIVTISLDLPFALKRFCAAEGLEDVITVSDYREREFANSYGLLIDELKLLARSVVILNENLEIVYIQICNETAQEPDYDRALEKIKELVN